MMMRMRMKKKLHRGLDTSNDSVIEIHNGLEVEKEKKRKIKGKRKEN